MKSILIVEDDEQYRDILNKRLTEEGYSVITATNGSDGLDKAANNPIDLVLLDLFMPKVDGNTFFYHFKDLNKNVPVIILTNLTETAYPYEVKDFIIKSNTSLDDVVKKIKKYL
jgi:DNA-binding response OmpR family regulator